MSYWISSQGIASAKSRLQYIANIRVILVFLVVFHHVLVGYGAGSGKWYYNNPQAVSGLVGSFLTSLWLINHAFFMGFFFLLSSYFLPRALAKRGGKRYLAERFRRLGIPLVSYIILINPILQYLAWRQKADFRGSILEFVPVYLKYYSGLDVGVMWFLELLLIFSILIVAWQWFAHRFQFHLPAWLDNPYDSSCQGKTLTNRKLILFSLLMAVFTFADRMLLYRNPPLELLGLPRGHIVQYIFLFVVGLRASSAEWFSQITVAQGRLWTSFACFISTLFFCLVIFIGRNGIVLNPYSPESGWNAGALLIFAVMESLLCVAMIITFLYWGRLLMDRGLPLLGQVQKSTFAIYVVHTPVVTALILLLTPVPLAAFPKFLVALFFALLGTVLIANLFRRTKLGAWVL
ncbi:acyltransferase family protein [Synechococcus sp. CBW1107]|uniref:acyltransferase family protein n=1 Tax=Synechococcus sp. CBW1107 TaxID=2789857 RepID=UPI002AD4498B|nr:acyltransferase family protein [Synechococcus sp. CBW1107]